MTERSSGGIGPAGDAAILGRLDRIPVWPYRRLTLWVLGAGYVFAFFDIVNIGSAMPVIAEQFGVSSDYVSWAVTASLVAYIVGAYLDGTISDIWGRRISLAISVALFSVGSVGAAFSYSVPALIVWRAVAGLGIGAEIASVTTYIGEVSPRAVRGRYTSWATTCAYAGFAAVPFVARALVPNFDWGWRALFLIGAIGGVTILFMRRGLPETPRWLIAHGRAEEAEAVVRNAERNARESLGGELPEPQPARERPRPTSRRFPTVAMFQPPYLGRVSLLIAIWFFYYIGNYGWLEMAPTLLKQRGYTITESLGYLVVTGIGFLVGALLSVAFNDRFERKFTAVAAGLVWVSSLFVIGFFPTPAVVMAGGFIASTTIGLMVPIMYTLTAEHFGTAARATGVAATDGLGHLGGALAPIAILWAAHAAGFAGGLSLMAVSGLIVVALLPFCLGTTGRSLETVAEAA
ncbi:MAG TPA: MFS transporter [Alphaproteobacteria bacterium]|nr:MFS transporter [Alphaproteobacteria bacterium]